MRRWLPISETELRAGSGVLQLLLLVLTLSIAPHGLAMEEYVSPLAPADTSSPRATLTAFRNNFERAFRPYYETGSREGADVAARARSFRTLAISKLPPAQARRLASEAMLLINEVLD